LLLLKVLSIFLLILLGFGSAKLGWLPVSSSKYLSTVVINIACPCAIINSLSEREFTAENASTIGIVAGLFTISMIVIWLVSLLFLKVFRVPPEERGIYGNMIIFPNNGFMGLPISLAIFGSEGFFLMVCANIIAPILNYTYGVWNLTHSRAHGKKFDLKSLLSMPVISSVVGLIIFFGRIPIPEFLGETIGIAAACMTPLCMMVIGIQLSASSVVSVLKNYRLLAASLCKVLLTPLVITALCIPILHIWGPLIPAIIVLNAMMPTAAITVVLAEQYECNARLASEGSFLSTLFSIGSIPLYASVLHLLFKV
jgi:predicted permease